MYIIDCYRKQKSRAKNETYRIISGYGSLVFLDIFFLFQIRNIHDIVVIIIVINNNDAGDDELNK